MWIKRLFEPVKDDFYNLAIDIWQIAQKTNQVLEPEKFKNLIDEVVVLCKKGIIQKPNWGNTYVLLANAYYSQAVLFPSSNTEQNLLYAAAVIHKWKGMTTYTKDSQNGYQMYKMIENELKQFTNIDSTPQGFKNIYDSYYLKAIELI